MLSDIERIKDIFYKNTPLAHTEEDTGVENTYFIETDEKEQPTMNFISRTFNIVINITEKEKFNLIINNNFLKEFLKAGINLKSTNFYDSNKYGELELSTFRKFE